MKRILLIVLAALTLHTLSAAEPAACGRETYPLDGGWHFSFRTENSSDNARIVTLPHTWNTDPRADDRNFLRTEANYVRKIRVPASWQGRRLFVRCHGAETVADLFVNGRHAGEHRGSRTAFTFEVTDLIRFGADNTLQFAVSNAFRNDVLPTSSDFNPYGGLTRGVELIATPRTAVNPCYYGTDGIVVRPRMVAADRVEGELEVHLAAAAGTACRLTAEFFAPDGTHALSREQRVKADGKPITVSFALENPRLWSLSDPALYTVRVSVEEGAARDEVRLETGFRRVAVTADGGLTINGERIFVRGLSLAYDRADHAGALTAEDYAADYALLRETGANALRSPAGPHADALYDLCDREGTLVWIGLPFLRAPFLSDICYYPTERFRENGRRQLREMIAQHINRPSVVMWGLFTDLWQRGDDMESYLKELQRIAAESDPARPTAACSDQDGSINFITDLIVWQQDVGWERGRTEDVAVWSSLLHRNWSRLRSAVCYGAPGSCSQQSLRPDRPARADRLPESRQTRFHEEYARHLAQDSLFWGIWIDQLADYGSSRRPYGVNARGLVGLDRCERKDAFYLYKALWNRETPTLYIAERRLRDRDGGAQSVRIYSSTGKPVVRVNGDTVAVRAYAPCQYRTDSLRVAGPVTVVATAGTLRDSIRFTAGNPLRTAPPRDLPRTGGR